MEKGLLNATTDRTMIQRQKGVLDSSKTCHDETPDVNSKVHDFLINMNCKMEYMADGINKMGDAWQSLARPRRSTVPSSTPQTPTQTERVDQDKSAVVTCDFKDDTRLQKISRHQSTIRNETQIPGEEKSDTPFFNYMKVCPQKDVDEETTGPNTHRELASIANDAFSDVISYEQIKEIQEKYTRPKNCSKMVVPRMNKELWCYMNQANLKTRDIGVMKIQSNLTKASSAIIKTAEYILKNRTDGQEDALRACTDAICMLGNANTSLSLIRRRQLRPILGNQSNKLCNRNVPINSLLFGDNLSTMGLQPIKPDQGTKLLKRNFRQAKPMNRRRHASHLHKEADINLDNQVSSHHPYRGHQVSSHHTHGGNNVSSHHAHRGNNVSSHHAYRGNYVSSHHDPCGNNVSSHHDYSGNDVLSHHINSGNDDVHKRDDTEYLQHPCVVFHSE